MLVDFRGLKVMMKKGTGGLIKKYKFDSIKKTPKLKTPSKPSMT